MFLVNTSPQQLLRVEVIDEGPSGHSFPIEQLAHYQIANARGLTICGNGRTIAISSKSVTFIAERELTAKVNAEVIVMASTLDGLVPLQLALAGEMICGERSAATMRISRYEFRTKRRQPQMETRSASDLIKKYVGKPLYPADAAGT
jgi:hypothetical protein